MKTTLLVLLLMFTSFADPNPNVELSKENLWIAINKAGVDHPDIVFGQAILESGNLTSALVRSNNNLFGMKMPNKRETIAESQRKGYAVYETWMHSVLDFKLYQDYIFRKKKLSRQEYISYINKRYAEVGDYFVRVKRAMNQNKDILNTKVI